MKKVALFLDHFKPTARDRILDVGPGDHESESSNMLEKLYPYRERITALGIGNLDNFRKRYPEISTVIYDGSVFPFENDAFDLCWSNAVLEHVGGFSRQVAFVREIARTSTRAMITTPNRYFPYEVHSKLPLLHYLPKTLFDKILVALGERYSWAAGSYMRLLDRKEIRRILAEAGIKDYTIHANRILGIPLDYCIVVDRSVKRSSR